MEVLGEALRAVDLRVVLGVHAVAGGGVEVHRVVRAVIDAVVDRLHEVDLARAEGVLIGELMEEPVGREGAGLDGDPRPDLEAAVALAEAVLLALRVVLEGVADPAPGRRRVDAAGEDHAGLGVIVIAERVGLAVRVPVGVEPELAVVDRDHARVELVDPVLAR
ncbi:MAG: hypothetical protein R3B09_18485 [Nannocystaceae bacterium]